MRSFISGTNVHKSSSYMSRLVAMIPKHQPETGLNCCIRVSSKYFDEKSNTKLCKGKMMENR
eukprot:760044-Hanusia_phi.AAC.6